MASVYMYMKDKSIHAELVLLIAVTALTRKVVVLDADAKDPMYLIGLAALLGTLIGGFYSGASPGAGVSKRASPDAAEPRGPDSGVTRSKKTRRHRHLTPQPQPPARTRWRRT